MGMVLSLRVALPGLLLGLSGVRAFHDDDCELASDAEAASLDWRQLRGLLASEEGRREAGPLLQELRRRRGDSRLAEECALGVVAGCLADAREADVRACVEGISLVRMLASRWPLFRLLAGLQHRIGGNEASCDDVAHPSLNWAEWRARVAAFGEKVPPWLMGTSDSEVVPPEYNDAVGDAQGIVWKASSAAVAQGQTVAAWTGRCPFGVLSAYAVRAAGLVLGDGDVYRIVERAIESSGLLISHVEEVLHSPWHVFDVLHALSLMKRTLHDVRLSPKDLGPLPGPPLETERSATWQAAAAGLRRAAGAAAVGETQAVLMTALPHFRVQYLMNLFKHADRLGFLAPLVVVPLRENVTAACEAIVELFTLTRRERAPADWAPCLPFVSHFLERAQFLYLHVALQLGLVALWFDFHLVWVRSPLPWLRETLAAPPRPPRYHDHCRARCTPQARPEVFLAEEFYARHWPRSSILLLRPTEAVRLWLGVLLRWLCTFPFANVKRGLRYLAHPDQPDAVPSISMLPNVEDTPRVLAAELDAEQQIVGFDGWFGDVDRVLAYEVSAFIPDDERTMLLDKLLTGDESSVQGILKVSRKLISPFRPTQRLYDAFKEDRGPPEDCPWQHTKGAYVGGYADDIEEVFQSTDEARCLCMQIGAGCRGITCDGADAAAGPASGAAATSCTLRRGEPLLAASPSGEESFVKLCDDGGCDAVPIERVVHVNFADGCCEAEQKQSSETARQFGAGESRALRGDFLDVAFRRRNHHLLKFNRTPELTQHKTPSGKVGYYVWKPYVILRTIQDPDLPWDTTVVAYTDAGIHFVDDMLPLVRKYMRGSDVAATRTPMLEGDFSKRDAFILLDADCQTIMETNQIATGLILVRKTKLALMFLERWLLACEDPRIMTEEPSVLGVPDYFSFRNNNDDQTAFSLLFKRFGFTPFSVGERDAVVYTGRNLAKFIKASDDFAVGRQTDREDYLRAADEAAQKRGAG